MPFAEFMEAALYDPFHGYYASGTAKIGRSGDFYTAVSAGPLFGRLIACQIAEMWHAASRPGDWTVVEQGAAGGALSADILEHLRTVAPECYAHTTLRIVEPFANFQRQQAESLGAHTGKAVWHRSIQNLPYFTGVHVSNELLDAFPVHKLTFSGGVWMEAKVQSNNGAFDWCLAPIKDPALGKKAASLKNPSEGQSREVCLALTDWASDLMEKMAGGWILAFDYGMNEDELSAEHRRSGTLAAYRSHQRNENILALPGLQDLTAHVNFTDLSRTAIAAGWQISGYTDQSRFLTGIAPMYFQDKAAPLTAEEQRETLNFRTLTHPQLMGGQFKVLCLSKGTAALPVLSGLKWAKDPRLELGL